MNLAQYRGLSQAVLERLRGDPSIGRYIDPVLGVPDPYGPPSGARLFVLGQDPTVRVPASRSRIRVVLNLDRKNALRSYIAKICGLLGLDIDREVYATNLANNFFIGPPTDLPEQILKSAAMEWAQILERQLSAHPQAMVITLGQPVLTRIVHSGASGRVRTYWGYERQSPTGRAALFMALDATKNSLNRTVFPFPHQPSATRKAFYAGTLTAYSHFVAQHSTCSVLHRSIPPLSGSDGAT
jgi:hypothetical protein